MPEITRDEREQRLRAALDGLARSVSGSPPSATEALLLDAFRRRRYKRRAHWPVWLTAAAALVIATLVIWSRPAVPRPDASRQREVATDFIPLRRGPILLPDEASQIIRIELPRREMRRFGIPVSSEFDESRVQADVIVGQDGMARAVRFIR